ncbi:MAG: SpoIIE family protein phosphatase [Rhodothermales bacterium]|nr:SpoIIE family protein phosphatase [Rhodothermales bacterium]MBO6779574.1 SpoIIE family protein phosphatase [Rhodothermales bacterium]
MTESELKVQRTERFDLRALYETSRILNSSLELEFVLNNLLLTAMSKLLVTRGAAFLYDQIEGAYRVAAVKGIRGLKAGEYLDLPGLSPGALAQGEAVPATLADRGIDLAVSVAYGDRVLGLLALGPKALGRDFESRELEFVHSLVNMSSAAVHNSLMVEELKQANRDLDGKVQQLNTLFDLSQEFNATVDRARLVKLLSLGLMGQMLVSKHLFLLGSSEPSEDAQALESEDGTRYFRVVTSKGVPAGALGKEALLALCRLETVELVGHDASEAWTSFREQGLVVAIPIRQKGETGGVLCLGPKMTGKPYGPDDVEFLISLGNLAFVSLQNSFLVEQQLEKQRLEEEIRLARQIQEGLQPASLPEVEGLEIATLALPSRHVAGDYYDVVELDGGRILLAIADVTGKGMPASLLMSNLQAALHSILPMDITLEEATANMNRVICRNTGFDKFITYFHGIYHKERRTFRYVNAGHNPPMLLRATGEVEELETGGLLLGVMKGMPYEAGLVTLEKGDVLAIFTDGVTEAMSPDGEEFEEPRLEKVLREASAGSAQEILDGVRTAIREWTADAPTLSDDLTMIVVKAI